MINIIILIVIIVTPNAVLKILVPPISIFNKPGENKTILSITIALFIFISDMNLLFLTFQHYPYI